MDDGNGHNVTPAAYLERLINERDRQYRERWENQQRELRLARDEMERRLEGLNELRSQVVEDRARFVTRELFDAEMDSRGTRLNAVEVWTAKHGELPIHPGAARDLQNLSERVKQLEVTKHEQVGSTSNMRWLVPIIMSAAAVLVALIGLFVVLAR